MSRLAAVITAALVLLSCTALYGQELMFNFSQNRDTYTWSDSLTWEPQIGGGRPLLVTNNSNAILIKESFLVGRGDRWQEDYRTRLHWRLRDDSKLSVGTVLENDYRSFEERTVVDNSAGLKVTYMPLAGLSLSNTNLFVQNRRNNYGNRHQLNGYRNQLDANYAHRMSRSSSFTVGYSQDTRIMKDIPVSSFQGTASFRSLGVKDSLRLAFDGEYQSMKYFTTSRSFESISRQNKTTMGANLLVSWIPISETSVRLTSDFDTRHFRYKHYDSEASGVSRGLLGSDNFSRNIGYTVSVGRGMWHRVEIESHYMFRELEEEYSSLSGKQKIRTGEFGCRVRSSPGMIDSVWAEATFSVTGYMSDRFSDRDRLMELYGAGFMHRLSSCLSVRCDGSYRDNHQTYVSGTLSANNNHNEVYVLSPEVSWWPAQWLMVSNRFLLHANYTWYDYDKGTGSDRNTLFRRAQWRNEYELIVSRRLSLTPSYTYKYEDYGQLMWKGQWVQKTNWDRRTHLPSLEITYRPIRNLRIDSGVSYEWKRSWEFALDDAGVVDRVEKETFRRTLIRLAVGYSSGPRTNIELALLRRVQKRDVFDEEIVNRYDDTANQYTVNIFRRF